MCSRVALDWFAIEISVKINDMDTEPASMLSAQAMVEAALGAHVEVPTPAGPVTIEVPAGTQTSQRFRLLKRGVPHAGGEGRGDLYVEADVRVPRVADDRSRELLREFARLNPEQPWAQLDAHLERDADGDAPQRGEAG